MKILILTLWMSLLPLIASAGKSKKSKHHGHEAHVHGSAKLAIAFDNLQGQVEFKAAAEGILGFEHAAHSAQDKQTFETMKTNFEQMQQYVQFDPALNCQWKAGKIELSNDKGEHGDFVAQSAVNCAKSPLGSKLKIDFSSFSRLKDLDITVLMGDLQKSAETKGPPLVVDLSK